MLWTVCGLGDRQTDTLDERSDRRVFVRGLGDGAIVVGG
jgi:hypothetical protein